MSNSVNIRLFSVLLIAASLMLNSHAQPPALHTDTAAVSSQTAVQPAMRTTEATDTIPFSDSAEKRSTTVSQKPTSKGKGKKSKQPKAEPMPEAVDNSQKLLAAADSLAMLAPPKSNFQFMFLPIIFVEQQTVPERKIRIHEWRLNQRRDSVEMEMPAWYTQLAWDTWFERYFINRIITQSPWLVPYNIHGMPEPPKQYEVTSDVKKNILVIQERKMQLPQDAPEAVIKPKSWIHAFNSSFQFSQSYLSENWYQGGTKNLNLIGSAYYNLKLNQTLHPDLLFELTAQYKLGTNSAPDDELRNYAINEDLFQVNAQFGLKATKKFYYSMNMQFKTQLFNNYETNTYNLKASLLTPGELNTGVGMAYSTKNSRSTFSFDASLSPLSYNLKICKDNHRVDPTTLGVDPGKHFGHEIGSSGECKVSWTIIPGISLSSRLFLFSDYDYLQGDFETTLNFSVTKYLSTQIFAHLRYDDSAAYNQTWKHWQFKEILSFGLQYRFNM